MAPDDPEVLIAAALESERKPDPAAARHYLEKGGKLHPANIALALGLARLETRERHPERGEAILRRAFQANPSVAVAFELAESLILQDKVEGKDQAVDYVALLRNAGLGDTLVPYLEAEILVRRQRWSEAIPRINLARAVSSSDPRLTVKLDLMLAECFGRLGSDAERLDALRSAAEGDPSLESVRIELARTHWADPVISTGRSPSSRRWWIAGPSFAPIWCVSSSARRVAGPAGQPDWQQAEAALREAEKKLLPGPRVTRSPARRPARSPGSARRRSVRPLLGLGQGPPQPPDSA